MARSEGETEMTYTPSRTFTVICIVAAFLLSQFWQPSEAAEPAPAPQAADTLAR